MKSFGHKTFILSQPKPCFQSKYLYYKNDLVWFTDYENVIKS